jgi:hypothetical protein
VLRELSEGVFVVDGKGSCLIYHGSAFLGGEIGEVHSPKMTLGPVVLNPRYENRGSKMNVGGYITRVRNETLQIQPKAIGRRTGRLEDTS